jgi:hypothetical protein
MQHGHAHGHHAPSQRPYDHMAYITKELPTPEQAGAEDHNQEQSQHHCTLCSTTAPAPLARTTPIACSMHRQRSLLRQVKRVAPAARNVGGAGAYRPARRRWVAKGGGTKAGQLGTGSGTAPGREDAGGEEGGREGGRESVCMLRTSWHARTRCMQGQWKKLPGTGATLRRPYITEPRAGDPAPLHTTTTLP